MLELRNVNAYYGQAQALHGLSLEIGVDEIVTLLGRNGAGKTTTFRSIMGAGPRVEGDIRFNGENIAGWKPEEIFDLGISWVPEEQRIFPNLTVEENLKMGERSGGQSNDYDAIFELFPRLEERIDQRAGTMSGGEQQMLALGRALISDPELLLVDEPFEGLMPKLVDEVAETLRELSERDLTMVITEQQTETVLQIADRAIIIEKGKVAYEDDASSLAGNTELQEQYLGVH